MPDFHAQNMNHRFSPASPKFAFLIASLLLIAGLLRQGKLRRRNARPTRPAPRRRASDGTELHWWFTLLRSRARGPAVLVIHGGDP